MNDYVSFLLTDNRFSWFLLAAFFLAGCEEHSRAPAVRNTAPPPPTVTVATPEQRPVIDWETATARIDAVQSVEVRPRVSGHITAVRFQAGQFVHKGDALFVIDQRWYQADLLRAQAELARAQATVFNAQRISRRADELLRTRTISQEEADARRSELDQAVAALKSAEAVRDTAQLDLEQSEVRAPIDGRISRALLTEGNYASGVAGSNSLLTTIVSVDPVYAYATVDEAAYLRITRLQSNGQLPLGSDGKIPVQLELSDEKDYPRSGVVESFDNRVSADTARIIVRITVPNQDGRLTPGLFARVRIPSSSQHQALLLTEDAIGTDQGQKYVLVVNENNIAEYRKVTLGSLFDDKRVITSGLGSKQAVIVDGQARVRPGMPVSPQPAQKSVAIRSSNDHS
jgi:membrane fusion protein, multidrug efflux system